LVVWSHLLDVVHGLNGSIGISIGLVTNETETTAATSVAVYCQSLIFLCRGGLALLPVLDNNGLLDHAKLLELGAKSLVISVPCEATIVLLVMRTTCMRYFKY